MSRSLSIAQNHIVNTRCWKSFIARERSIRHNASNERVKREYGDYLVNAKRQGTFALDGALSAIRRFEEFTDLKDFRLFKKEDAKAFKESFVSSKTARGSTVTKATIITVLGHIRRFFQWHSDQAHLSPRFQHSDADYLNPTLKQSRSATRRLPGFVPSVDQIRHMIACMPTGSEIELRNRAIVAFILLTAARVASVASGITEQTYYRWKAKFGGIELSEMQRLKQVEDENRRLRQIVAEQSLDLQALKAVVANKW